MTRSHGLLSTYGVAELARLLLLCSAFQQITAGSLAGRRAVLNTQTPFRTALQDSEWALYARRNLSIWRSHLFTSIEKFLVSKGNSDMPPKWERYDFFQPFITCPPGRPLRRVGPSGDGGKWLCEPAGLHSPCNIISIGSNMDFGFEESILQEAPCYVATLDCTVEGKTLPERHTFHKLCVGSAAAARRDPKIFTYSQVVSALGIDKVDIMKIDVESFEIPFLGEFREHSRGLPNQIAVELHHMEVALGKDQDFQSHWGRGDFGVRDFALFFFHLANLGYGIVSQEINQENHCCSEFTLMRVETLPHATATGSLNHRSKSQDY